MKRALAAMLAAMMLLSFTACNSGNKTPTETPSNPSETPSDTPTETPKGNLEVLITEESLENEQLMAVLDKWCAETGNTYETQMIPYNDLETKFRAMAKSGEVPDLMTNTGLAKRQPESFIDFKAEGFDLSVFTPALLAGDTLPNGEVKSVRRSVTLTNVFYNKDLFEQAGITAPTKPEEAWTWDEMIENAKVIMEKTGVKYGAAMDFSVARYNNLMYGYGGSITEADGDSYKITINSPQNVATLEKFISWNNEGIFPKAIWANATSDQPVDYFKNGDAAMLFSGSWQYDKLKQDISAFDWHIMVSPKGDQPSAIPGGSSLAIPADAKNKALALDFLTYFYKTENFEAYNNAVVQISPVESVSLTLEDPLDQERFDLISQESTFVPAAYAIDNASDNEKYVGSAYREAISLAVAGNKTAQQALDDFANALNEATGWTKAY